MGCRAALATAAVLLLCLAAVSTAGCQGQDAGGAGLRSTGDASVDQGSGAAFDWERDSSGASEEEPADGDVQEGVKRLTPTEYIESQLGHYAAVYERVTAVPDEPLDDEELEAVLGYFTAGREYESVKVLIAHVANDDLRERIVEECGRDEFNKYAAADLLGEGEGFADYLAKILGEEFVEGHSEEIEQALGKKGLS